MAARGRGGHGGRGQQAQLAEIVELRCTVEDLSRVVRTLQRRENAAGRREALDGDRDPFGTPEGSLEDEEHTDFREDINPFHGHGFREEQECGIGLEDRLVRALDLNGAGIKIEVADFFGQMHAEDYLDWEASLETYFEWKPMVEERKVLFVKLKLKGAALQWWKRIKEQRSRQGKQKISTWEHMKTKLHKQFLPADYAMELYEKFHSLKQRSMSVDEYTSEFNNLSIRVGLSESNEQLTSRYLSGLNQAIRDEIGVARLFSLEDARQYALMAEKRVLRYGGENLWLVAQGLPYKELQMSFLLLRVIQPAYELIEELIMLTKHHERTLVERLKMKKEKE
uniref:Retrotransposon gag domain-containing protein n=1 Tax=Ananas comosus var. bracteatus TaxID=296719 RepID=A0A6V7QM05_ANACO|nr:unnamed protein product [Ananas comosus var. bracteatus]